MLKSHGTFIRLVDPKRAFVKKIELLKKIKYLQIVALKYLEAPLFTTISMEQKYFKHTIISFVYCGSLYTKYY